MEMTTSRKTMPSLSSVVVATAILTALCVVGPQPAFAQTSTLFPNLLYNTALYTQTFDVVDIPDGVTVNFANDPCTGTVEFSGVVAAGKLSLTFAGPIPAQSYRLCNAVGNAELSNGTVIIVRDPHVFTPVEAVASDNITMALTGDAAAISDYSVYLGEKATSSCQLSTAVAVLCQFVANKNTGACTTVISPSTVSPGTYPICINSTSGFVGPVFQQRSLTVFEYSSSPNNAVKDVAFPLTLTGAPCDASTVTLSLNSDCSTAEYTSTTCTVTAPAGTGVISGPVPVVTVPGTYHVCVMPNTTNRMTPARRVSAGTVAVAPTPVITFSPDPIVRAVETNVTMIAPTANVLHLAEDNTCATVFLTLTVNEKSSFVLPTTGPTAGRSTIELCVTMLDGALYHVGSVSVRDYETSHGGLITSIPRTIEFDNKTAAGDQLVIVSGADCAVNIVHSYTVPTSADATNFNVTFANAGNFSLCARANATEASVVDTLPVWAHPTITPSIVVPAIALSIAVSDLFLGATTRLMQSCSDDISTALATATLSDPSSPLSIGATFPSAGTFAACVDYPTSASASTTSAGSGANIERINVGSISSISVTHAPTWLTSTLPNVVSVDTLENANGTFYLAPSSTVTCTPALLAAATVKSVMTNAKAVVTPTSAGNFTGCLQTEVGGVSRTINTGVVAILPSFTLSWEESYAPLRVVPITPIVKNGLYAPDRAIMIAGQDGSSAVTCDQQSSDSTFVAANVTLSASTGVGSSNSSVPNSTVLICALAPDGENYVPVATAALNDLVVKTTTIIDGNPTVLLTEPTLPEGLQLALTPGTCGDAGSTVFPITNNTAVVGIPSASTYRLCVSEPTSPNPWTAGTQPVIKFVPAFSATGPSSMRRSAPSDFVVTSNRDTPRVYIVPTANAPCHLHVDNPTVFFTASTAGTTATVTVTPSVRGPFTICALSSDGTVAMPVGPSGSVISYTDPPDVPKGVTTNVKSGASVSPAQARITFDSACTLPVGASFFDINAGVFAAVVPAVVAASPQFYICERPAAAQPWVMKDVMGLLEPFTVTPSTFEPGAVPEFQITPPTAGSGPFFSTMQNCSEWINASVVVFPEIGENIEYYVCITSTSGGTNFTTANPQAKFTNFSVAPAELVSDVPTNITLTPSDQGRDLHLSTTPNCSDRFKMFTPGQALVSVGQTGTIYVCLEKTPSEPGVFTPVEKFTSHAAPTATIGPKAHRLPFCFNLTATYPLYGQATALSVYVAPSASGCGDISNAVWSKTLGATAQEECMPTTTLGAPSGPFVLCAPTPSSGDLHTSVTPTPVSFPVVAMSPAVLLTGTETPVTFTPASVVAGGDQALGFVLGNDCAAGTKVISFTPAVGGAAAVAVSTDIAPGNYSLCFEQKPSGSGTWALLTEDALTVTPSHFFSVSSDVFAIGRPTAVVPMQNLTWSYIRGFSRAASCSNLTNDTVTIWEQSSNLLASGEAAPIGSASDATSVYVVNNTDAAATGTWYLCAEAPLNKTIVVAANLTFLPSIVEYTADFPACLQQTLSYAVDFAASDATAQNAATAVSVYNGDCCVRSSSLSSSSSMLNSSEVASTAVIVSGGPGTSSPAIFTQTVTAAAFNTTAGNATISHDFHICVTNEALGLCRDAGVLNLTRTEACAVAPVGGSSGAGPYLGGAVLPTDDDKEYFLLILLAALFLACCCLCCGIIAFSAWIRNRKAIPKEQEPEPEGGWDTFVDRRGDMGEREGREETLHDHMKIPADMVLAPLSDPEAQRLLREACELDQETEHAMIREMEQNEWDAMMVDKDNDLDDAREAEGTRLAAERMREEVEAEADAAARKKKADEEAEAQRLEDERLAAEKKAAQEAEEEAARAAAREREEEDQRLRVEHEKEELKAKEEREAAMYRERELTSIEDIEDEARAVLRSVELEERRRLVDVFAVGYGDISAANAAANAEAEAERARRKAELEERARSRKRRLLESSSAMMHHIDKTAQLRTTSDPHAVRATPHVANFDPNSTSPVLDTPESRRNSQLLAHQYSRASLSAAPGQPYYTTQRGSLTGTPQQQHLSANSNVMQQPSPGYEFPDQQGHNNGLATTSGGSTGAAARPQSASRFRAGSVPAPPPYRASSQPQSQPHPYQTTGTQRGSSMPVHGGAADPSSSTGAAGGAADNTTVTVLFSAATPEQDRSAAHPLYPANGFDGSPAVKPGSGSRRGSSSSPADDSRSPAVGAPASADRAFAGVMPSGARRSVTIFPTRETPYRQPTEAVVVHSDDGLNPFRPSDTSPDGVVARSAAGGVGGMATVSEQEVSGQVLATPLQERARARAINPNTPNVIGEPQWMRTPSRASMLTPMGPPRGASLEFTEHRGGGSRIGGVVSPASSTSRSPPGRGGGGGVVVHSTTNGGGSGATPQHPNRALSDTE